GRPREYRARRPEDPRAGVHRPDERPRQGAMRREGPALPGLPAADRVPRRHREHVQEARAQAEEVTLGLRRNGNGRDEPGRSPRLLTPVSRLLTPDLPPPTVLHVA